MVLVVGSHKNKQSCLIIVRFRVFPKARKVIKRGEERRIRGQNDNIFDGSLNEHAQRGPTADWLRAK